MSSAVNGPWVVPDAKKVTYLTDVEGHWPYFCNFVELSECLSFAVEGDQRTARKAPELILKDDWHFVFGGDTCDKGPGSLRCLQALVSLKRRYPDRVHLLMGNRDINKMRLTSEYTDQELALLSPESPAAYWVPEDKRTKPWDYLFHLAESASGAHPTEEEIRGFCTGANLLRYHLKYDMGSDGEFEFRRQELAHMAGCEEEDIGDEEVMQSYKESVAEGGLMREYLRLAELTCLLGQTLFVHGQLIGNHFHHCGTDGVAWSVKCVPNDKVDGGVEIEEDLRRWVEKLNTWAHNDVAAWMAEPTWRASPRDATYEAWAQRAGAELIAYGTPASHVPSVVYCRWLEDNCMPKQYPPDLLGFLVSQGVSRVIVGHTPHGNCPTVIPHEGLTVIMGDTSYSNMKSDLAYPGDNRGDAVCEIAIFDDQCVVRGRTGATAEGRPRQVVHYVVTESSSAGDPHIGVIQPPSASVPLDACFFVKACLPAMEGKDARYLLCKVDGFTNTYQEESPAEVLRVFGSQSVLKANATTRKRLTSHGEEFGASCSAEGDVLEHIFRRLDRDHDGVVTAHELLTACSDPEVRRALQWTFPDTCLEDVFRELDANQDGIVTLHEFQSRVKRS